MTPAGGEVGHVGYGGVRTSRVPKHWLFDREDARTVLIVSVLILAFAIGASVATTGIPWVFIAVWIAASVAQVIYAIVRLVRERRAGSAHRSRS